MDDLRVLHHAEERDLHVQHWSERLVVREDKEYDVEDADVRVDAVLDGAVVRADDIEAVGALGGLRLLDQLGGHHHVLDRVDGVFAIVLVGLRHKKQPNAPGDDPWDLGRSG